MTRFEVIQKQRREAHEAAARATWAELRAALGALGIEYRLFGSLKNGDFMEHSDIDLMIMGDPDQDTVRQIRQAIAAAGRSRDIDIDLHFARDMTSDFQEALLER
ncbi:hypothetical protein OCH239_10930 [Roseivivax halodurans JCM 10272]|uniref:Polymerase beta nucleotidyltransferase domain-containing protein n=1 Tax=Roseivivax halodurans JCM 10272 TaxID=1449350 RepID=X7EB90_9RHOB|nr:nucleotidyltransferase domain-containing protein [Roseivivax halodurans]ETX13349.1 hypothetical protein OCH239_10930 [Roseivivax halodurans JCM 10272]